MKYLISIIVPIYNVEEYLNECVTSIVNQTYKNLEIILVDDGSSDNCPAICDEWLKKDKRIVVMHKKNGGQSSARNAGLDIAKGEYIGFVDSDDFISEEHVEKLFRAAILHEAQIAAGNCYLYYNQNKMIELKCSPFTDITYNSFEVLPHLLMNEILSFMWNKLFHKSIFENVRFKEGQVFEDWLIMHTLFLKADKIDFVTDYTYFYRQRVGSTMHTQSKKLLIDTLKGYVERGISLFPYVNFEYKLKYGKGLFSRYIGARRNRNIKKDELEFVVGFLDKEIGLKNIIKCISKKDKLKYRLNQLGLKYWMQYKISCLIKGNREAGNLK